MNDDTEILRAKLQQAREVIAKLVEEADIGEFEGQRLVHYFSDAAYDPAFLPWTRQGDDGIRPENLNAANDD